MIRILCLTLAILSSLAAQELRFKPPEGWSAASAETLPPNVKFMCVGKGRGNYPPSINLGIEPYKGTLKDYLGMMERVNKAYGDKWTNLGLLDTAAGKASLSQVEMNTQWGAVKLMHLVLIQDRKLYILTAAAKREEFSLYTPALLNSFKSVSLTPDVFAGADPKARTLYRSLLSTHEKFLEEHPGMTDAAAFATEEFQQKWWLPFEEKMRQFDAPWSEDAIAHARSTLTATYD